MGFAQGVFPGRLPMGWGRQALRADELLERLIDRIGAESSISDRVAIAGENVQTPDCRLLNRQHVQASGPCRGKQPLPDTIRTSSSTKQRGPQHRRE